MVNNTQHRKANSTATASGRFTITKYRAGTDEVLYQSPTMSNVVLNQGLALIANRHVGTSSPLDITTLEITDDDTAPSATDTALGGTVVDGFQRANQSASGREAALSFFLPDAALPNGTYNKLGVRTAGDVLYTAALIDPSLTKSDNEDIRIDYTITYSAV